MASVTSLPELMTGVSSVAVAGVIDIAFGDIMGSCVFNLLILALMDPMHRARPIFFAAGRGHILSAAFSVALITVATFAIMNASLLPSFYHISIITPIILFIYIIGMRTLYLYEKSVIKDYVIEAAEEREAGITLNKALIHFTLNAVVVIAAAIFLPFIADDIAVQSGLGRTFVGSVFVALTTSLPEVVVSIAAIRIGALDMAVANMFGSNMFNIMVLAIDDIVYTKGPIFADVSVSHGVTGMLAILMSAVAIMALIYRPQRSKILRFEWGTLTIMLIGLLNFLILYLTKAD